MPTRSDAACSGAQPRERSSAVIATSSDRRQDSEVLFMMLASAHYDGVPARHTIQNTFPRESALNPPNRFLTVIRSRPRAALLVLLLVLLASVLGAFVQGERSALERLVSIFDRSSMSRRNLLQRDVQNPLLVPEVLATSGTVRALLAQPNAITAQEQNLAL